MNLNNQAELETYFADNFDTVLFPILADMYLQNRDLVRARKVCEIGLGYHPDHVDGRFILAMIELEIGNERESEKLLKEVVQSGTDHLQASFQLAIVQQSLGRAESTLQKSWNKVLDLDPENREAKSILSILGKQEIPKKVIQRKKISMKSTGKKTKTRRVKKTEGPQLAISPRIATFTMVNVLKNQNLYHQALDVLDILVTKGADAEKIEAERVAIKELLKAEK
jgi:tetratricopeptide (TPR) repeat protein